MSYQIISLARTIGSGGDQIARDVAAALGFRLVDQEIVARSAEKAGVSPDVVARAEQKQPFLVRLLETLGRSALTTDAGGQVALPVNLSMVEGPERYEALIEEAIRETAAARNVVIVGHGASIPLAGTSGLLRIFITGSPGVRIKRVMEESLKSEDDARKLVEESDSQRLDYLRRFYDIHEESPALYDLVINTDLIAPARVVDLLVWMARAPAR